MDTNDLFRFYNGNVDCVIVSHRCRTSLLADVYCGSNSPDSSLQYLSTHKTYSSLIINATIYTTSHAEEGRLPNSAENSRWSSCKSSYQGDPIQHHISSQTAVRPSVALVYFGRIHPHSLLRICEDFMKSPDRNRRIAFQYICILKFL